MDLKKYRFLFAFLVPIGVIFSLLNKGVFTYYIVFHAFILIPTIELFHKADFSNLSKEIEKKYIDSKFFDILLYLMVPIQYIVFFIFLNKISSHELQTFEKIGLTLSFGISCGILGINVAHELGHRLKKYEQIMAKLLLLTSQYLHFFIEHNRGHHKHVSTDEDAASAVLGENIYSFHIRSIIGSYLSAWKIENESLARKNISIFSWKNQMIRFHLYQLILNIFIVYIFSLESLLYYLGSAFIGILLLESVNYIQHYGLRRKKIYNQYERVNANHSWNSNFPLGRIVLFELSRHSDHHQIATRKYQILRNIEDSPQMPTGYPGMIILAFIPPLWFKIMNKKIN